MGCAEFLAPTGHQVRNKAAHIAVGVDLDGIKHVLGIWVQASEGAKFWAGVCAGIAGGAASYPKQIITLNDAVVLIRRVAQQPVKLGATRTWERTRW